MQTPDYTASCLGRAGGGALADPLRWSYSPSAKKSAALGLFVGAHAPKKPRQSRHFRLTAWIMIEGVGA